MGKRGPKPKFNDVACLNTKSSCYGVTGKGNVTSNGTFKNQTTRGHPPTLKGWGMLRAARFG